MPLDIPEAFLVTDCTACGQKHAPIRQCEDVYYALHGHPQGTDDIDCSLCNDIPML